MNHYQPRLDRLHNDSADRWKAEFMSETTTPHNDEKSLDPAVEAVRRRLARLLAVSIGIMMVGLFAVLGAIVYRLQDRAPAVQAEAAITVPQGATIIGEALDGDRIMLRLQMPDGSQMLVIHSAANGQIVSRFTIGAEPTTN
jgi:hypothetical protein